MSILLRWRLAVCSLCLTAGVLLAGPQRSVLAQAPDDEDSGRPVVKKREDGAEKAKPDKKTAAKNPFPNRIPAAELDGGTEWLNSSGPLSLKDVRGKVVLLDFWTYCCINCMHVLPDLAYLEKKFDKELVVIGVHSAKFDNERETGNIRKAILRYEIAHPVVNDARMAIWKKFGVNSWPTLVLIDPEGYYCGYVSGEGNRDALEQVIEKVVAYHRGKGTLDETPVRFHLERLKQPDGPLRFPGKVLADTEGSRLFISDSNHNRIVITSLDGTLQDVIGTGQTGATDGPFSTARFDHPQGMCLVEETLYVADTENHLLRAIDLQQKTVSTFAGTGKQAHFRAPGGPLLKTSLNSPWDLTVVDGTMYIAMAGPHQIWSHKLGEATIQSYAGSGREDIRNGALKESAMAQPSGIVTDGDSLYVVDSEGSSVRRIATQNHLEEVDADKQVTTIVGSYDLPNGRCLFEFGDVDGIGDQARLQHPLGITIYLGKLLVADSYNHKIKLIDPVARTSETWLGTGKPGRDLKTVELSEPAGLAVSGSTLFIADTNNHRIVKVDLDTKEAAEFTVKGLKPPDPPKDEDEIEDAAGAVKIGKQTLKAGDKLRIEVRFELPEDYKLNTDLPAKFILKTDGSQKLFAADVLARRHPGIYETGKLVLEVPLAEKIGTAELTVSLSYGYCRNGNAGLCKLGTSTWRMSLDLTDDAKGRVLNLNARP